MLDPAEDEKGTPVSVCLVFVFGPDKKLKLSILYPATTGRNFEEIFRVVLSPTDCGKRGLPLELIGMLEVE